MAGYAWLDPIVGFRVSIQVYMPQSNLTLIHLP